MHDASASTRLLRIEAEQRAFDAEDGDLLTHAVERRTLLLPVHRLLVVVGGQVHGWCARIVAPERVRVHALDDTTLNDTTSVLNGDS